MPLLVALAVYMGSFTGYIIYDNVQPIVKNQIEQNKKDWSIDKLTDKVEKENEVAFDKLDIDDELNQERGWESLPEVIKSEGDGPNVVETAGIDGMIENSIPSKIRIENGTAGVNGIICASDSNK